MLYCILLFESHSDILATAAVVFALGSTSSVGLNGYPIYHCCWITCDVYRARVFSVLSN